MPHATGSRQRCSPSQAPCDQKLHDLIGARIDTRHPGVTIHSRDRKFVHVAIPTKKLQATVDDFSLQVGQPILGHGGGNRIERAGKVAFDAMVVRHARSEEHTSELQSPCNIVCRLLLEKKKKKKKTQKKKKKKTKKKKKKKKKIKK